MRITRPILTALPFLLAFAAGPALAATAVSNLTAPGSPNSPYFLAANGPATSFTTGPLPSTLSSITVPFSGQDRYGTYFGAYLLADDAGHPGPLLESFPIFFSDEHAPLLTFPSAGLTLASNATYWLSITAQPQEAFITLSTDAQTSDFGWTIGDQIMSYNATSGWGAIPYRTPTALRFSVDATILPEPTFLSLLAAPCLLIAVRRRRPTRREGTPMRPPTSLLIMIAAMLCPCPSAHAAVAVTNLTNTPAVPVGPIQIGNGLAISFTTGPAPSLVSAATLSLSGNPGNLVLLLRADQSGFPYGSTVSSAPAPSPSSPSTFTYHFTPATLAPLSTYWLLLGPAQDLFWNATDADESSNVGWTIGNQLLDFTPQAGWVRFSTPFPQIVQFSIDATILPEPATLSLAALPYLALRRRRR